MTSILFLTWVDLREMHILYAQRILCYFGVDAASLPLIVILAKYPCADKMRNNCKKWLKLLILTRAVQENSLVSASHERIKPNVARKKTYMYCSTLKRID